MKYVSGPDGTWIPANQRQERKKEVNAPMVWDDLKDYKPVAGPEAEKFIRKSKEARYISGRKQHREFLKRNGFQEVGSDITPFVKNGGKTDDNPTIGWLKHGTSGKWSTPDLERLMRGKRR